MFLLLFGCCDYNGFGLRHSVEMSCKHKANHVLTLVARPCTHQVGFDFYFISVGSDCGVLTPFTPKLKNV